MLFVTAKKPIKGKRGGKDGVEIEVSGVEFPQFESLAEFVTEAGSEENALKYVNKSVEQDSKVGPRNYITNAPETDTIEQIIDKAKSLMRGFSIKAAISGRVGKAAKAEKFDEIQKFVTERETFTRDELLKLLESVR